MKIVPKISNFTHKNNCIKRKESCISFCANNNDRKELDKYIDTIRGYGRITREEEIKLAQKLKLEGEERDEARKKLILSNLMFVVKIALEKSNKYNTPLMDLVQEGNLGLYRATEDYNGNFPFVTYAVHWIKNKMSFAERERKRVIRLPDYLILQIKKLSTTEDKLTQKIGREPYDKELAKEMGITLNAVKKLKHLKNDVCSLDEKIYEGDETDFTSLLADEKIFEPAEKLDRDSLKKYFSLLLLKLKKRQRKIVMMYFGLNNNEPMTYEQIAAQEGVTRQAIECILKSALNNLKKKSNNKLNEFIQ